MRQQRATQRHGRQRRLWPLASIVGYTNAGKSTLLNTLTGASVLAENKLFATLDPTTRRLRLPTNQNVLLSDTVGFIRKLPHRLVEAFKATLEEVVEADLLLHVVDVSHPQAEDQINAVNSVLEEIGAHGQAHLDGSQQSRFTDPRGAAGPLQPALSKRRAFAATTGQGVPALLDELSSALRPVREFVDLAVPHDNSAVIARLHEVGQVIERNYEGECARFKARIPPHLHTEFAHFIVPENH